ncbi:MAG: response regulator [Bacteroidota bacterium]|nr:response regulator [Bacteroidota bacterium]
MAHNNTFSPVKNIKILLADDDVDDRFFFTEALNEIRVPHELVTIDNGELLMKYLKENSSSLPNVLFLDLNMPRKNGAECLKEIKLDKKLQKLPVIIYSTSLHDEVADELYAVGAHYYIRKTDLSSLEIALKKVIDLLVDEKFARPSRNEFILSLVER